MNFNDVNPQVVDKHLPQFAPTEFLGAGGQKRVFKCRHDGDIWALPLIMVSDDPDESLDIDDSDFGLGSDQVIARLQREVSAMKKCDSQHLVKMGPINVSPIEFDNLSILYFLEEFIDGEDLKKIIAKGPLPIPEIKKLAIHVTTAIDDLWTCDTSHRFIHRDLKPANIMQRSANGQYVVLDIGMALDLLAGPISDPGQIPGTARYYTPEQLDSTKKWQMDFRTDLGALGLILYEAATGEHPYWAAGMSRTDFFKSIVHDKPNPVRDLRADLPEKLADIITQLLAKRQHLRYRTCESLLSALEEVEIGDNK